MRMYILSKNKHNSKTHKHFGKEEANAIVNKIYYTTRDGVEHHGAFWSMEQVKEATKGMQFSECVTDYDKYVAFNLAYADLNKVLNADVILEVAHAFFFEDEDAPCNKVWIYAQSFF